MEICVMYHFPSNPNVPIHQPKMFFISQVHYIYYYSKYSCQETGYKTAGEYVAVPSSWKHQSSREEMWLGSIHATYFRGHCTVSVRAMPLEHTSVILLWTSSVYEFTTRWGWNPEKESACFLFLFIIPLQILKKK